MPQQSGVHSSSGVPERMAADSQTHGVVMCHHILLGYHSILSAGYSRVKIIAISPTANELNKVTENGKGTIPIYAFSIYLEHK